MVVSIKAIHCYGDRLIVNREGDEAVVAPAAAYQGTGSLSYYTKAAGYLRAISIDFDNGYSLLVGEEDGYGPTKAWLTYRGDSVGPSLTIPSMISPREALDVVQAFTEATDGADSNEDLQQALSRLDQVVEAYEKGQKL